MPPTLALVPEPDRDDRLDPPFEGLLDSFLLTLAQENKSPRTMQSYGEGITQFSTWLRVQHRDDSLEVPAKEMRGWIREFVVHLNESKSPATARNRYAALRAFFEWALAEGETDASPMTGMNPPAVPEKPIDVLTVEQMQALVATCKGKEFLALRDAAIIRTFLDTGVRKGELLGMNHEEDVDVRDRMIYVMGKGSRPRACPIGARTALALDRYLRARRRHRFADAAALWVGERGVLGETGVQLMLRKRGALVGLDLHPHMLRHTWAHHWRVNGGSEGDLMRLGGWRSRAMLDRYGASEADARAREAHRERSLGDKI